MIVDDLSGGKFQGTRVSPRLRLFEPRRGYIRTTGLGLLAGDLSPGQLQFDPFGSSGATGTAADSSGGGSAAQPGDMQKKMIGAQTSEGPAWWEKVLGAGGDILSKIYGSGASPQGTVIVAQAPQGGAPSWLLPVALLGGAGALAYFLLRKKD